MRDGSTDDAWAPLAERFVDHHYSSLRGRVRTHVIHEHLRRHLLSGSQRVVDVGGGAGNQSVPLAQVGHQVTIVDPSPAMLERAAERLEAEEPAVAGRVRLVEAAGEDAVDALGGAVFDAVLCHGVVCISMTRTARRFAVPARRACGPGFYRGQERRSDGAAARPRG